MSIMRNYIKVNMESFGLENMIFNMDIKFYLSIKLSAIID